MRFQVKTTYKHEFVILFSRIKIVMMTTFLCDIRHVFILSFPLTSFSRKKTTNQTNRGETKVNPPWSYNSRGLGTL
jgi:hypothetical protein